MNEISATAGRVSAGQARPEGDIGTQAPLHLSLKLALRDSRALLEHVLDLNRHRGPGDGGKKPREGFQFLTRHLLPEEGEGVVQALVDRLGASDRVERRIERPNGESSLSKNGDLGLSSTDWPRGDT